MTTRPVKNHGVPGDAVLIYAPSFSEQSLGDGHPFRPDRASALVELLKRQGWLSEPWMRVEEPGPVPKAALERAMDPGFLAAIERASAGEIDASLVAYGLGSAECPIFPGLSDYVGLYCAATMRGVRAILEEGADLAFNPLGGMHHASRSHAEGFCYVNDAILAIDALLAAGHRVAYIDIDAHHGNGVQDAYLADPRVLVASIHESGETLYPWCGREDEVGEGEGRGFTINVPLPAGADDEIFELAFNELVVHRVKAFVPTVTVAVVGADSLRSDPLSHLQVTNNALSAVLERIRSFGPRLLMLGGGGYDAAATVRAWARLWATANDIDALPDYLYAVGGVFLGAGDLEGADLIDAAFRVSGDAKRSMMEELRRLKAAAAARGC